MRVYAVLLGVMLTAGSAYVAQIAVAGAGFERLAGRSPGRGGLSAGGELWYGGVLDPITIETARAAGPAIAFAAPRTPNSELAASQQAVECARLARPKRHANVSESVRASVGSMM